MFPIMKWFVSFETVALIIGPQQDEASFRSMKASCEASIHHIKIHNWPS